ncbi:hypothetical protein [Nocardiopsis algeriensis]|uniref:Uncharacterized protein n=1 Tax=Nocardiopsis algeriensis TaxID=1478215 RepID=A0A841IHW2_9ACTN|nr:hypothetical protein [Nocardiopsis algeriensis]MBB6118347.1 hypothetical protein [Nocardiopsis algeriensis]
MVPPVQQSFPLLALLLVLLALQLLLGLGVAVSFSRPSHRSGGLVLAGGVVSVSALLIGLFRIADHVDDHLRLADGHVFPLPAAYNVLFGTVSSAAAVVLLLLALRRRGAGGTGAACLFLPAAVLTALVEVWRYLALVEQAQEIVHPSRALDMLSLAWAVGHCLLVCAGVLVLALGATRAR